MSKEGILSIMIQEHDDDTFKVRWEIWHEPCCKFTADSNSEKIVKIGQHFTKLWTNIVWHVFRAKGVETMCPRSGHLCPRSSQTCPRSSHLCPRLSHLCPRSSQSCPPYIVALRGAGSFSQLEPLDGFSRLWLKWRVLAQGCAFWGVDDNPQF